MLTSSTLERISKRLRTVANGDGTGGKFSVWASQVRGLFVSDMIHTANSKEPLPKNRSNRGTYKKDAVRNGYRV